VNADARAIYPCGGVMELTDSWGTIKSPEYEPSYPPQTRCNWRISGPPGKVR